MLACLEGEFYHKILHIHPVAPGLIRDRTSFDSPKVIISPFPPFIFSSIFHSFLFPFNFFPGFFFFLKLHWEWLLSFVTEKKNTLAHWKRTMCLLYATEVWTLESFCPFRLDISVLLTSKGNILGIFNFIFYRH